MSQQDSRVLVLGGGSAGISVAARLRTAGQDGVTVVGPSDTHDYQPLWNLAGGGRAPIKQSRRAESSVMPRGVQWVKDRAETVDPDAQTVTTASGTAVFTMPAGSITCAGAPQKIATSPPTTGASRASWTTSASCSSRPPRACLGCPSSPPSSSRS